jgi:hypothetical protein
MTDRSKFEQMLEYLINEDKEKAQEIFHDIVVEKSREIYENLLADDFEEEDMEEGMEDEEDMEEAFGDDMGGDDEGDDMGGDPSDDLMGDTEMDGEEGDEEGGEGEGDIEDRVMDLEDALDELKSEFEQLMAGDEGEDDMGMDDMGGDDMGMDDMGGDDMGMDAPEDEGYAFEKRDEDEDDDLEESLMREYVEKVGGATYDKFGKMGDNGVNTKSIVAGKNDMGGTTANIAKSFSTEKGGTQGGLLKPTTTVQDGGNINKPGGNAGKTSFKKKEPGHGAEKKGKPEQADRGADSLLNGVKSRAK